MLEARLLVLCGSSSFTSMLRSKLLLEQALVRVIIVKISVPAAIIMALSGGYHFPENTYPVSAESEEL